MGGFVNLKQDYDTFLDVLKPKSPFAGSKPPAPADVEKFKQDVFRYLYLRSQYEIAGNLDTIALCSRAVVEQLENIARHVDRVASR